MTSTIQRRRGTRAEQVDTALRRTVPADVLANLSESAQRRREAATEDDQSVVTAIEPEG